jgi:hypothetical protein
VKSDSRAAVSLMFRKGGVRFTYPHGSFIALRVEAFGFIDVVQAMIVTHNFNNKAALTKIPRGHNQRFAVVFLLGLA